MSPAYTEFTMRSPKERITIALLENGEKIPYDLCNTKKGAPKHYDGFKYIGSGLIYSVEGILKKYDKNLRDFYVYGEEDEKKEKKVRKFNRYTALTNRDK